MTTLFDNNAPAANSANTGRASSNTESAPAKKQSSKRRIEASRANGKKSRGPVTEEGKARSSQNSRKHAILASRICLSAEDEEIYCAVFENYEARFQPRDQAEFDLLEEIVFYKFQMRKCWMQQSAALSMQIARDKNVVDSEWSAPTDNDREVIALENSSKDSKTIVLLQRYARTLSGQAERAIKQLIELQRLRIPPPPAPTQLTTDHCPLATALPNDPNPEIEHCESEPGEAQLAIIRAYTTPAFRIDRVHFPREISERASKFGLLARAA
jgi:hypothetical protein